MLNPDYLKNSILLNEKNKMTSKESDPVSQEKVAEQVSESLERDIEPKKVSNEEIGKQ